MSNLTENYFPLFWAYDRLGTWLFGREWKGNEYRAHKQKSPEEIKKARLPLEKEFSEVQFHIDALNNQISREVKEDVLDRLKTSRGTALNRQNELRETLDRIPKLDERYLEARGTNERHTVAEARLIEALQNKEIEAWLLNEMQIPPDLWHGYPGFQWYLECSLAVMPKSRYSKRRSMIVLERSKFENWLSGITPLVVDEQRKPSTTEQCVAFLREAAKNGTKQHTKQDYFEQAKKRIPELSRREFDRVWDREAPKHWKRSGRPRTQ